MLGWHLIHSGHGGFVDDLVIIILRFLSSTASQVGIGTKTTDHGSYLELGVDLADTGEIHIDEEVCIASKDGLELAGSHLTLGKTCGSQTELAGDIRSRGPEAPKKISISFLSFFYFFCVNDSQICIFLALV